MGPRNDLPLRSADRPHRQDHRNVRAGSIVGSGTVSNKGVEQNGYDGMAHSCQLHRRKRCIETIQDGKPSTEFMKFGDTIRIEVKGATAPASSAPSTGPLPPAAAG